MSVELLNPKIFALEERARMLSQARSFFAHRGVIEVDTPLITKDASIDAHIDLMPALYNHKETRWLISSPEHCMKRLLADGMTDIYQLGKVFRDGECGDKHNPEFTLCEWYRIDFSFTEMIEETVEFIELFIGERPLETMTYRQAFLKYAQIDYLFATEEQLKFCLKKANLEPHVDPQNPKESLLNQILALIVEPNLGQKGFTALTHYPANQAGLAKVKDLDGEEVAERFEVYYQGYELANGYNELNCPMIQKRRYEEGNERRVEMGKTPLPLDHKFIKALEKGLPDCCGVAVGFDRLMMLKLKKETIDQVIPFSWKEV